MQQSTQTEAQSGATNEAYKGHKQPGQMAQPPDSVSRPEPELVTAAKCEGGSWRSGCKSGNLIPLS